MTRHRVFSLARITGHSVWWVFMVVTLFAGGITWTGASSYGYGYFLGATSFAGWSGDWTANTPIQAPVAITDFAASSSYQDPWTQLEVWSVVTFVVVLIAAVVEAIAVRQVVPGIVTVAAPCVAFGLLLLATPGVLDSVEFSTMLTVAVVLVAVAVREIWARGFAPRPSGLQRQ
ncbi:MULTISPECIES: hypothetical protein [Actinomycetes]|jgi:hypothetical protein|uniref:hypothetical protein n=1 Tax=Actinomycetes TaxID=1760 RepID=UPI0012DE5998|nr:MULTISPECIES: hypothetical protein [Actinomycetes]